MSPLRVFCRINWFLVNYLSKITPGQSTSLTWLSNFTYLRFLVHPGIEETSHVFDLFKLLITLLFPTLGYPINPTVTALVDPSTLESCLNNWIKWSGPIALLLWIKFYATSVWLAIDFLNTAPEDRFEFWFCIFALNRTTGYSLLK